MPIPVCTQAKVKYTQVHVLSVDHLASVSGHAVCCQLMLPGAIQAILLVSPCPYSLTHNIMCYAVPHT